MPHIIVAIIVTVVLTIIQIAIASPYPFALISFAAWMWWAGMRNVTPWAGASVLVLDLYSPLFGSTICEWIIILGAVSIVSVAVLTNRSLFALLAITVGTFVLSVLIHWMLWYGLSFLISGAPVLSLWGDIDVIGFITGIFGTVLYSFSLWLIFTKGKRGRRVYLVSEQAL